MTMRSRLRLIGVALAGAALTATLVAPADAGPRHGRGKADLPDRIALPAGFQPEGIATAAGPSPTSAPGPTATSTPPTCGPGRAG